MRSAEKKNVHLTLRITPEERDRFRNVCERELGMKMSQVLTVYIQAVNDYGPSLFSEPEPLRLSMLSLAPRPVPPRA